MTDDELRGAALLTAASDNGWRVLGRAECATITVPGGALQVHPKTAAIFADLAARFHAEVEPLVWPGCWGYALRPIKGTDTYSNHSSGTAIDLNAPAHPQGVAATKTFSRAQITAIRALVDRYHGVITWGGEWKAPSVDGMHFEVTDGTSVAAVDALAASLGATPSTRPRASSPAAAGAGRVHRPGPDRPRPVPARRRRQQRPPRRAAAGLPPRPVPAVRQGPGRRRLVGPGHHRRHRRVRAPLGIPSADGLNVGPKLAAALYAAGFDRSTAQARALAHRTRRTR
jgi:hypothetical protein